MSNVNNNNFAVFNCACVSVRSNDQTRSKRFQCTQCMYRCNTKGNTFIHLKHAHRVTDPLPSDVRILSLDEAAGSLELYELNRPRSYNLTIKPNVFLAPTTKKKNAE